MLDKISAQDLLENAFHEVESAINLIFDQQPTVPFTSQTDLQSLSPHDEALVRGAEETSYRERPTLAAVNFCLASCISSLAVAHCLLAQSTGQAAMERARVWKKLARDTRQASLAAGKAEKILSDPMAAEWGHGGVSSSASSPPSSEQQLQLAQRNEVLEESSLRRHWNRIKAENITASQFIEFLRPLADLDGICVSHMYGGEGSEEQASALGGELVSDSMMQNKRVNADGVASQAGESGH